MINVLQQKEKVNDNGQGGGLFVSLGGYWKYNLSPNLDLNVSK